MTVAIYSSLSIALYMVYTMNAIYSSNMFHKKHFVLQT